MTEPDWDKYVPLTQPPSDNVLLHLTPVGTVFVGWSLDGNGCGAVWRHEGGGSVKHLAGPAQSYVHFHIIRNANGVWVRHYGPAGPIQGCWRVGAKLGRTLYRDGVLVGLLDTSELAAEVVAAMNALSP